MTIERAVWLVIAEGGWWTPAEVMPRLPYEYVGHDQRTVANRMWIMAERRGYLKRKRVGTKHSQGSGLYAVTKDCCMPYHVTVGEVMTAVGGVE